MTLSLTAPITDHLVLQTIGGGVPFLLKERPPATEARMHRVANGVDWVALHFQGPLRPLSLIRLYSACGVVLAPVRPDQLPPHEEIDERLGASLREGTLGLVERPGYPVRFRISPLRYGRWELRDHLVTKYGWENTTTEWDINIEVVGPYLAAQVGALHISARLGTLRRSHMSTSRIVASILALLLDPEDEEVVYDPFCGTGTILVEALARNHRVQILGSDRTPRFIDDALVNVGPTNHRRGLFVADAASLPLADGSVSAVAANMPFGKRGGSHRINLSLYPAFARELRRILVPGGRAVLLTEEKKLIHQALLSAKLRIEEDHLLTVGGLHPSAFVVLGHSKP